MQVKRISFAALVAVAAMPLLAAQTAPSVSAPVAAPVVAPAAQANIPVENWLWRMGDFSQNASAFKDPRVFTPWFGAMTDPSMVAAAMPMMMEPGSWIRTSSSMMQPGMVSNYMGFTDPNVAARWMGAAMDPNFYMQNAFSMTDPNKLMRWMMLPMDPRVMQTGMSMLNPNTHMKWMMAPMDPRVMGMMLTPMNPQFYGSMAGAVINPGIPFFGNAVTQAQAPAAVVAKAPVAVAPAPAPAMQPGVSVKLSLAGDTLFKISKSSIKDLTDEGKAKLDKLAADIKAAGKIDVIRVVGHADKTGKASANMTLSQKRAATVVSYLKAQGVKAGKFITAGMGDAQPVVQCDSKLPKAELIVCNQPNRRVEVEVTVAK